MVDTSGYLVLEDDGNWAIFSYEMEVIWSAGLSTSECCFLGEGYECTPTCTSFDECWEKPPPPTPPCEDGTDNPCTPPKPDCEDGHCGIVTCDDLDPESDRYKEECCKEDPSLPGCGGEQPTCDDLDPTSPEYKELCGPPPIIVEDSCDDIPTDSEQFFTECCHKIDPEDPRWIERCQTCDDID